MKSVFLFFFFLFLGISNSMAQVLSVHDQKIYALKNLKILPHQYFELSGTTFTNIYNGLNEATLKKTDSLEKDSKRIAKEVYTSLGATNMEFIVYYFDKVSYNFGKGLMYRMRIKDGNIVDFRLIQVNLDKRIQVDHALMARLHQYALQPNQYIIPYYSVKEGDPAGLCLSTIVDDPKAKNLQGDSKKLYDQFIKVVRPSTQYPLIVIRYHSRYYGDDESVFTYPAY